MLGRRLEYQSLKAVLLHMDANVRFRISLHMPSIRSVEKVVPLKINSLVMVDGQTKVNDIYYKVEILRHYPERNCPLLSRINPLSDFDEFGFPVVSGANVLLPGDVSFQEETLVVRRDTEEDEIEYRRQLSACEKALMILNEFESRGLDVDDYLKILQAVPDEELSEEELEVRDVLTNEFDDPADCIRRFKLHILPFDCRKNNTKPPFNCYIQLSIWKEGSRQVKRYEYNRKCFEAAKHLHEVLFGDRTMPIRVGEFSLKSFDRICRLPVGFRLQVNEAHLSSETVTHRSVPLIVENWESLSTLEIDMFYNGLEPDVYKSQLVRNARRLIIYRPLDDELDTLIQVIKNLPNWEIRILSCMGFSAPQFIDMIQAWLSGNRRVGASLWMHRLGVEETSHVVAWLLTRYEEIKRTMSSITFDLRNSTALEASCPSRILRMNIVQV